MDALKLLTTASNASEAEIISARLAEAGIQAIVPGGDLPQLGAGGAGAIYIEDEDLDRAREAMKAAESISEDELIQAEEQDAAARHLSQPPE
jgi:hypothetical protein